MKDCPNCEYHKARAKRWREEAYKQAGHPLPEREWAGLTDEDRYEFAAAQHGWEELLIAAEAKLKEKNT